MDASPTGAYLKLFSAPEFDPRFTEDLDTLLALRNEQMRQVFEFIGNQEEPDDALDHDAVLELQASLGEPYRAIEQALRSIVFIVTRIAGDLTAEDVGRDLLALGKTEESVDCLIGLLQNNILDRHPRLREDAARSSSTREGLARARSLGCAVDLRAVYDEAESLTPIALEPVLVARLSLSGARRDKEVSFQLSSATLDKFLEVLQKGRERIQVIRKIAHFQEESK